jgi:hypothetical protein
MNIFSQQQVRVYYIPTHICRYQGVTKRCRLSWLTNSALVYEPKCGGRGGGGELWGLSHMSTSTAVHMEPKLTLEI